jgi:hypothetical protein
MLFVLLAMFASQARASATLLLQEPYGKLGFFTATGHVAVYLSGVCEGTPLVLRLCNAGESGIVLSRYNGVGGYDWIAVPLIPYLYAVETPEEVPLFADAKMVAFLRDRYRRAHLQAVAPDLANGETPGGNWYELVGTSYDRTVYGFTIETSLAQDEALVRKYNSSPNRSHFRTISNNCADFAKDVINFYYPKALHRSLIADIGITTPKQMAKLMVRFGDRHPELEFSRLVIVQVPGGVPRSTAVHGVVESFFKSKKYIVPSAIVSPIFAGCVAAVYVGTGSGRFDPARNALIFKAGRDPELPLGREDRRAYQKELAALISASRGVAPSTRIGKAWGRLQSEAVVELDNRGRPILQMRHEERLISLGVSADNVLSSGAPPQLVQQLLEARLQTELHRSTPPRASGAEIARDWRLLQEALEQNAAQTGQLGTAEPDAHSVFAIDGEAAPNPKAGGSR